MIFGGEKLFGEGLSFSLIRFQTYDQELWSQPDGVRSGSGAK